MNTVANLSIRADEQDECLDAENLRSDTDHVQLAVVYPNGEAARVRGFLDGIDGCHVYGWAIDDARPDEAVSVEVLLEGKVVARGMANKFRQDLADAGIGNGCHQFRLRLPRWLLDGMPRSLAARECLTETELMHSPITVQQTYVEPKVVVDAIKANSAYQEGAKAYNEKKWPAAERSLKSAISLDPTQAKFYAMLGQTIEKIGRTWEASEAFADAVEIDPNNAAWMLSHATLLEKMNRWDDAAEAYQRAVALKSEDADRHYYLGYALAKSGRHTEAQRAYSYAIELDKGNSAKIFGIGAFHAKRGLWREAAVAYEETALENRDNAELFYRLGLAHDRCYRWAEAAAAYRNAIALNTVEPGWHYRLGFALERAGDFAAAAEAYQAAVARQSAHTSSWYYRLGFVLSLAGRHQEAGEAYASTRTVRRPYGVDTKAYDEDKGFQVVSQYTEYFDTLAVKNQWILYESFHGASMTCNPYAVFKYLLSHPQFKSWNHVWVINDLSKVSPAYKKLPNVIFVKRGSDLYLRYLCTAKVLVNNVSLPEYFIRKDEQVYLNTWHGTPLKTLGKDIKQPFFDHKNVARNFLHASHLISPNAHTTHVITERYDIAQICTGVVAETGYPRVDLTVNATAEEKAALRERLQIPAGQKVILYAPTWRGTSGKASFDADTLIKDLEKLNQCGGVLLFKGHHMVEKLLADKISNTRIVPGDIDTNELLSIVDVLITDYSSIYIDFLVTGRPILHYVYDYEAYNAERGLYFALESLPGTVCRDIIGLCVDLRRTLRDAHEPSASYRAAQQQFSPFDDGKASARVVDLMFSAQRKPSKRTGPKTVLFFGGALIPNGINSSFMNLLGNIDRKKYTPVVAIDPNNISTYPDRMEQFERIGDDTPVLGRVGRMNITPEERWIVEKYNRQFTLPTAEMSTMLATAYKREFRRIFGNAHFDLHINFEGYSQFWSSLFAFGPDDRNIIYLHNDMQGEWQMRFPFLESVLNLYPHYEKLVSVSALTSERNKASLPERFDIPVEKLDYCINPIVVEDIVFKSEMAIDEADAARLSEGTGKVFITMGRMSPEKDHAKLIDAFAEVVCEYPDAKLWILGDGPLRHELEAQIRQFDLEHAVSLLGQKVNPFPYMRAADCFVLSSNHEGQPMVLLEALVLGKPVISTDIAGARSVLDNGLGHLVENSALGMSEGMKAFLGGRCEFAQFDPEKYQRDAMAMFYKKLCGERTPKSVPATKEAY